MASGGYDWRPIPRRVVTCRASGCNREATVPDLGSPEGDKGWCDHHLLIVQTVRTEAKDPLIGARWRRLPRRAP